MKDGELSPTYDVRLARSLAGVDIERPMPPLWNEFDTLAARADAGDTRRQFGHPFGGHGGGDAGAAPANASRSR